jgi:uncharacterized protein (TIGR03083 family)
VTTDADRVIAALHSAADELDPIVRGLTPDQLTGPSAASEWDVSQVLSHLGSGAVISQATLDAALAGRPNPGLEANRVVWARWDAMSPQERADGYLEANAALLDRYDGLDDATRQDLRVDIGFLPAPVDLATAGRLRLNEVTLHSWDVRVALDPAATLRADAVPLLLEVEAFLFGWLAKPAELGGRDLAVAVTLPDLDQAFGLTFADGTAALGEVPAAPDATLTCPGEAWLRLVSGRLAPSRTPDGVAVTGDLTLDELRRVFPGY